MRYIKDHQEQLAVFTALGSEVRIEILKLLLKKGRMSMNDLAQAMGLTGGALTAHIRKLENGGRDHSEGAHGAGYDETH